MDLKIEEPEVRELEDGEDDLRFSNSIFLGMIGYDYNKFETE